MADAAMTKAERREPMAAAIFANEAVTVRAAPLASRLSLRAGSEAIAPLSSALGVDLPVRPKQTSTTGSRTAMWIGPDEWLVIDAGEADLMAAARGAEGIFSAVDISHRNVAFLLSGTGAATTLASACPHDLRLTSFPVGAAARTLLAKAEVVLWRQSETEWHVECWRSFAPYVFGLLREGAKDAALA